MFDDPMVDLKGLVHIFSLLDGLVNSNYKRIIP